MMQGRRRNGFMAGFARAPGSPLARSASCSATSQPPAAAPISIAQQAAHLPGRRGGSRQQTSAAAPSGTAAAAARRTGPLLHAITRRLCSLSHPCPHSCIPAHQVLWCRVMCRAAGAGDGRFHEARGATSRCRGCDSWAQLPPACPGPPCLPWRPKVRQGALLRQVRGQARHVRHRRVSTGSCPFALCARSCPGRPLRQRRCTVITAESSNM